MTVDVEGDAAAVAYLDEVLALGLGDEWLQLGGREGVDKACLRHDQKQHLCTREHRQFVGLGVKTRCQHEVQTKSNACLKEDLSKATRSRVEQAQQMW